MHSILSKTQQVRLKGMSKNIYSTLVGLLFIIGAFHPAQAQPTQTNSVPQKMSYQAVIRNSSNALLTSTKVGMRISILKGSATGTVAYSETQTPSTNGNGLVSLEIGTGKSVTGTFAGINWAAGPYFIKTETDPTGGTAYTIVGTNELMSVPYALFSANGTSGPAGATGAAGQGGVTKAGLEIQVIGTGTSTDPYIVSSKIYTIGLWPELGGYVFRISADGRHGLVAEIQNQSELRSWYLAQDEISNPVNHSTNGKKFMDWRLPTKYELNEMYLQKVAIGFFGISYYWSSSENDYNIAWIQRFDNSIQTHSNKVSQYNVRAVRAF